MIEKGFSSKDRTVGFAPDLVDDDRYSKPKDKPNFYAVNVVHGKNIERCVMPGCGADTGYLITIPVPQRINYVDGAGQLCGTCYQSTYGGRNGR